MDGKEEASNVKRGGKDEAFYVPGRSVVNAVNVVIVKVNAVNAVNSNTDDLEPQKKRTWKKPKDKPKRPLSAYNIFFQNQRERIVTGKEGGDPITPEEIEQSVSTMLKSKTRGPKRRQDRINHGQISFGDLARKIASKWKTIDFDPRIKAIYNHYAAQEKIRYKKEVVIWKDKKESEHDAKILAKHKSLLNRSSSSSSSSTSLNDDSVRSTSSSVSTSVCTSLTSSFNPSDSISSSSHSSGSLQSTTGGSVSGSRHKNITMIDDVIQRQQYILRQQMGFIDSNPHASILKGGINDIIARHVPNRNAAEPAQCSRRSINGNDAVSGSGNLKTIELLEKNDNTLDDKFSGSASLLDELSLIQQQRYLQQQHQQQRQEHQERLLLQLQQQQLRHLQQLQQVRNETSRMINVKTTDMTSSFVDQVMSSQQPQAANLSSPSQLSDQYKQLDAITQKLDDLKQHQRFMQQQIKDHHHHSSNGSLQLDSVVSGGGNSSHWHHVHSSTTATAMSTIYNTLGGFSASSSNNNINSSNLSAAAAALDVDSSLRSVFDRDFESRQRMDGFFPISSDGDGDDDGGSGGGGSSDLGRRVSCPTTFHAGRGGRGQQQEYNADRRNSVFGPTLRSGFDRDFESRERMDSFFPGSSSGDRRRDSPLAALLQVQDTTTTINTTFTELDDESNAMFEDSTQAI